MTEVGPIPSTEELLARLDRVIAERIAPMADETSRSGRHPAEQMAALASVGLMGIVVPARYGGTESGNLALSRAMAKLARACPSTSVTFSVQNSLVAWCLVAFATEDQKSRYLPRLASGEWLGAYSLTESHSGSDAAALRCRARREGNVYRISGTKAFVTNGANADLVVLFARTSETEKASKGVSCFLVEAASEGFAVGKREKKMGISGSQCVEIVLSNVAVPAANLLGEENKGFRIAMAALDGGRIGIASQAVGIAEAALQESIALLSARPEGDPFGDREMADFRLAEMATKIDAARLLVERAAAAKDAGKPHTREAAMAKLFASQTANEATREAVALAGRAGISGRNGVERLLRDARITELYEGTTEIQKLVISRQILGEGAA